MSAESQPLSQSHDPLKAVRIAEAMAGLFNVNPDDFAVVQGVPGMAECRPTVAYVARTGIDLGNPYIYQDPARSWNQVKGSRREPVPDLKYAIEVDSQRLDTRKGMTFAVYEAMIAQNPNRYHPDYRTRTITGHHFEPHTLLTGDAARAHWAPVAVNDMGEPVKYFVRRSHCPVTLRFRPAVAL